MKLYNVTKLVLMIGLILFGTILFQYRHILFLSMTTEIHNYEIRTVETLCNIFSIKQSEFCINNETQNSDTLEQTLQDFYPYIYTDYITIASILSETPSSSINCSISTNEDQIRQIAPDNCPPPSDCTKIYECFFQISAELTLGVTFSNGIVTEYYASSLDS